MKRRIGSWLLTLAMVLALLPAQVMPAKAADITVTFHANDGTNDERKQTVTANTALDANPFTRAGYRFDGWNELSNGGGTKFGDQDIVTFNKDIDLYAQWVQEFTVTFYGNQNDDGKLSYGQKFDLGDTKPLTQNQFTRTGYRFIGWNTQANGSVALYKDQQMVTPSADLVLYAQWAQEFSVSFDSGNGTMTAVQAISPYTLPNCMFTAPSNQEFDQWEISGTKYNAGAAIPITADIKVIALWKDIMHTVKFNLNGHGTAIRDQSVINDGKAIKPTDPTADGYDFGGWFSDSTLQTPYDFNASVTDSFTLYAKWTPKTCSVTFDSKGGTEVAKLDNLAYGATIDEPAAPTKNDFAFGGWYKEDTFQNKWNFGSTGDKVTDNITLYARWLYTVTFDSNGGTGTMAPVNAVGSYKLPNCTFTAPAGKEFSQWEIGSTNYSKGSTVQIDQNTTVKAVWSSKTYTVTFNANGGSGTLAPLSLKSGTDGTLPSANDVMTRTGYAFIGWNTQQDGDGTTYADGASIKLTDRDITLYAQWDPNAYTVYFNSNGGTGRMEQQTVTKNKATPLKANTFTRAGYGFDGWSTNAGGTGTRYEDQALVTLENDNLTLYAQWNANKYTITFDANGGEGTVTPQTGTKQKYTDKVTLKANAFTRDRYDFAGWSTTASGAVRYADKATITPEGDLKLYAQWKPTTYIVSFDTDGGSEVVSQTVAIYGRVGRPDIPTKTGFVFDGWYREASHTTEWDFNEDLVDADITLYAKWTNRDLVVTFDANGGYGTMETQTFKPGKATALAANGFSRADRTFKGWNTKADGSGTDYADEQSITPAEDLTLYAMWDPSVTFHANDGTDGKLVQLVAISGTTPLNANSFTRQGYVFKGWNTEADGTGTSYSDKQNVKLNGSTDLYAVWTPYTYTVRFNANGGTGVMTAQKFNYGVEQALTANAFTRTGRTFQGWSRTVGGEVEFTDKELVKDLTGENGKTIMLYAVWNVSAAPGGSIWIQKGNTVFESTTPKNGDPYAFRVDAGVYNVVVTSGNKMVTMMVKSDGGTIKGASVIQPETVSSVLDVKENTPDIVVGNLDVAADSNRVRGAEAELRLTVESKPETASDADQQAIRKASPAGRSLDFLDLTLTKTVNGKEDAAFRQETKENLIIVIPFKKAATKDITVYRCHNGTVDTLTADAQKDEYIEVTDGTVTIYAKKFSTYAICYTPLEPETTYSSCHRNHTCPIMPFDDSNPMSWYHDGVHWALDSGAMQGVSPRRFYPNGTTDRAQFVTILWRLEGSPRASGSTAFYDIPADAWYTEAVRWAASNGIVTGVSPHYFNPGGTLTREQLATILYRYVRFKNGAAAGAEATGLSGFRDAPSISGWARDAMAWMATYGIFDGTTNSAGDRFLTPQGNATRAQTATVMMRCWNEYIG